jgi:SP family arabinose:H+ symporter-like MFS transporter
MHFFLKNIIMYSSNSKNKAYLIFIAFTAAMGGFLFGFDTAVISGAEKEIQGLWQLSDLMLGSAVAIALYGTVIGALLGSFPADRIGRKKTLIYIGIFYLVSALGSAFATGVYDFMFFRFIGGLGVGASSVVAPMYISEVSPARSRGKLVALFQVNIVVGILIAYISNFLIGTTEILGAWRWMLGIEALPALIYTLLVFRIPNSPRWLLIKHSDYEGAKKILMYTDPEGVDAILSQNYKNLSHKSLGLWSGLFSNKNIKISSLAICIAVFNQLSGINAIIYFAPRIFEDAGLSLSVSLLSTIGIGIVNLVSTLLGMLLIDRIGRRNLLLIGSIGYIISLSLISLSYFGTVLNSDSLPYFIFFFIFSHAIGQGAVIWVFISEIFPTRLRASGQSLGSFTHWFFAALITNLFPFVVTALGTGFIFMFFTSMMVLQLFWVLVIMPETKGKSLEEVEVELEKDFVKLKIPIS